MLLGNSADFICSNPPYTTNILELSMKSQSKLSLVVAYRRDAYKKGVL